jgi:hypothetical protein
LGGQKTPIATPYNVLILMDPIRAGLEIHILFIMDNPYRGSIGVSPQAFQRTASLACVAM